MWYADGNSGKKDKFVNQLNNDIVCYLFCNYSTPQTKTVVATIEIIIRKSSIRLGLNNFKPCERKNDAKNMQAHHYMNLVDQSQSSIQTKHMQINHFRMNNDNVRYFCQTISWNRWLPMDWKFYFWSERLIPFYILPLVMAVTNHICIIFEWTAVLNT